MTSGRFWAIYFFLLLLATGSAVVAFLGEAGCSGCLLDVRPSGPRDVVIHPHCPRDCPDEDAGVDVDAGRDKVLVGLPALIGAM